MARPLTVTQKQRLMMCEQLLLESFDSGEEQENIHARVLASDEDFYGRIATWALARPHIEDVQKQRFVANLLVRTNASLREAGCALLQKLDVTSVSAVVQKLKGHHRKVPRSTRTAVIRYLHALESEEHAFDREALCAKKQLKYLYATLRIKPSERADAILFKNAPPAQSLAATLKEIAHESSPRRQAERLVSINAPFTLSQAMLQKNLAGVLGILIEGMEPQDVHEHFKSLKLQGAMTNPRTRRLVEQKLEEFTTASSQRDEALPGVGGVCITRPTALLVDSSSSMEAAIELGQKLATLLCKHIEELGELCVYAFDTMPHLLSPALSPQGEPEWEEAFSQLEAAGATSAGSVIALMEREEHYIEQVVVVTDEGENTAPYYTGALASYAERMGVVPHTILVRVGHVTGYTESQLRGAKLPCETLLYRFDDEELFRALLPMLCNPSRIAQLEQIMATQLPTAPARECA